MIRTAPAQPDQRQALSQLHAASWRSAYRGQVPDAALGPVLDRDMAARWQVLPDGVITAMDETGLVGFIRLKRRLGWPYIDNLHVAPERRGGGIGAVLMRAAGQALAAEGEGRVWLTVLSDNHAARAFYARMGGFETAPITEILLGEPVSARPVIWTRLGPLAGGSEKSKNRAEAA